MDTMVSPRSANPFTSLFRLRRPLAILASLFVAATVASGTAVRWMTPPAPVFAACHAANGNCSSGFDPTKTAVVDAAYIIPGGGFVTPVEPGAATSWTIDAYWSPAGGTCNDEIHQATVDVSWNGTNWVLSNFAGTADFIGIGVCTLVSCGTHSSAYRMYVDINDPSNAGNNLRQVVFTAVTVPNGTDFNSGTCALGTSRTPTASSFNATDSGTFECAFNCTATGATLNLTYN